MTLHEGRVGPAGPGGAAGGGEGRSIGELLRDLANDSTRLVRDEIALDGVQTSTRYPGGVALRFARVLRYRDDKGPDDVDTLSTVRALLPP